MDFLISQIVKELPEGELQDRIKKPVTNNSVESLVTGFLVPEQLQTSKRVGPCSGRVSVVKEVIQPQVPLRLPCYDFTPVMNHTVVTVLPKVKLATSGAIHSHGVTGGVYKARERIHRVMLLRDY